MSATYDYDDGMTVCISDTGRQRLADEQRLTRLDRLYVEIRICALGGALLTIAGLITKQLLGI
ncbi:hypothetical protein FVF58_09350 [Paraburkholderia panacisoli]|uniref:Uncharacterized protein n=1 Tax=Paraburkholderia panacisoli TaxID=2603818 RepID=A0A5B0HCG7_9BURK|nr:hypothetical protein [Paraburkholderia panacisoli]KAA1012989.1 hypothetical protein FVF58_09350 [Paraburkholderia panacisoli]